MFIRNLFKRIICVLIIFGLIVPMLDWNSNTVFAKTITRRISLDPIPGVGSISDEYEDYLNVELEAELDVLNSKFHVSHNDWRILKKL